MFKIKAKRHLKRLEQGNTIERSKLGFTEWPDRIVVVGFCGGPDLEFANPTVDEVLKFKSYKAVGTTRDVLLPTLIIFDI